MATFEQLMPPRERSGLTEPTLAREILVAADGLIGGVAGLPRQAAVAAIRNGQERIDRALLAAARTTSPARIEAVAAAADL